jgi:glycosyltransferase involved in cell wall biosynthesis
MNMSKLVSVCIPVYNGALYIEETLNTLMNQTYNNIEIIVSDNASTDNTADIVKKNILNDKRIQYFKNNKNIGYCANILSAVGKASSDIVAIYHADDLYGPDIIEKQYNVLLNDNSIHGVFVKHAPFSPEGKISKPKIYTQLLKGTLLKKNTNLVVGNYSDYLPLILRLGDFFACPSFMTRKEIFLKLGGFKDTYPSNEDMELWIKYLQSGYKLAIINEFLLKYRISDNHASAFWRKSTELPVIYKVIDDMIISSSNGLNNNYIELYKAKKAQGYIDAAHNAYIQKKYLTMHENMNKSAEIFSFSMLTKYGFAQRVPRLACYIKSKLDNMIKKK